MEAISVLFILFTWVLIGFVIAKLYKKEFSPVPMTLPVKSCPPHAWIREQDQFNFGGEIMICRNCRMRPSYVPRSEDQENK